MKNRCLCRSFTGVLLVILCFVVRLEIAETQTELVDIGVLVEATVLEVNDDRAEGSIPNLDWWDWTNDVIFRQPNKSGVAELIEFILDMRHNSTRVAVMRFDDQRLAIQRYTTLEDSATKTRQELIDQIGLRKNHESLNISRDRNRFMDDERMSNITRIDFAQNPGYRPEATKFLVWISYHNHTPDTPPFAPLERLTNATNGPDLVLTIKQPSSVGKVSVAGKGIKSAEYNWDDNGKKQITDAISSFLPTCTPLVENSSCYFNQTNGPCVFDEKYSPKDATIPYCMGERVFWHSCGGDRTCSDICNLASTEEVQACQVQNAECGYGEKHFRPPNADADKYLRHCPPKVESCHIPCPPGVTTAPGTGTKAPPGTKSTEGSATTPIATSSQKSALESWHIALIVVGSLALVATGIFIIVCCVLKQKRRSSSKPPARTHAHPPAVDRRRDGGRGRSYDRNYDRGYDPRRPPRGRSPSRPRRHGYELPTSRGRTDWRPPPRRYPSTVPSSAPPSTRRY